MMCAESKYPILFYFMFSIITRSYPLVNDGNEPAYDENPVNLLKEWSDERTASLEGEGGRKCEVNEKLERQSLSRLIKITLSEGKKK